MWQKLLLIFFINLSIFGASIEEIWLDGVMLAQQAKKAFAAGDYNVATEQFSQAKAKFEHVRTLDGEYAANVVAFELEYCDKHILFAQPFLGNLESMSSEKLRELVVLQRKFMFFQPEIKISNKKDDHTLLKIKALSDQVADLQAVNQQLRERIKFGTEQNTFPQMLLLKSATSEFQKLSENLQISQQGLLEDMRRLSLRNQQLETLLKESDVKKFALMAEQLKVAILEKDLMKKDVDFGINAMTAFRNRDKSANEVFEKVEKFDNERRDEQIKLLIIRNEKLTQERDELLAYQEEIYTKNSDQWVKEVQMLKEELGNTNEREQALERDLALLKSVVNKYSVVNANLVAESKESSLFRVKQLNDEINNLREELLRLEVENRLLKNKK